MAYTTTLRLCMAHMHEIPCCELTSCAASGARLSGPRTSSASSSARDASERSLARRYIQRASVDDYLVASSDDVVGEPRDNKHYAALLAVAAAAVFPRQSVVTRGSQSTTSFDELVW